MDAPGFSGTHTRLAGTHTRLAATREKQNHSAATLGLLTPGYIRTLPMEALRLHLDHFNLVTTGRRAQLVSRLEEFVTAAETVDSDQPSVGEDEESTDTSTSPSGDSSSDSSYVPAPKHPKRDREGGRHTCPRVDYNGRPSDICRAKPTNDRTKAQMLRHRGRSINRCSTRLCVS